MSDTADLTFDDPPIDGEATKSRPIHKVSDKGVHLAVFPKTVVREDGTEVTVFNVVLERRYRDNTGDWQSSNWYSESQLAVIEDFARETRQFLRTERSKAKQAA